MLSSIVQALVLLVVNAWKQCFLSRTIASQFVGDNDSRGKAGRFEQLAEELLGRSFVTMALHRDIENLIVGIHDPSTVVPLPLNGNHNLVKMPFISGLGTTVNLIRVNLSKFAAPLADGLVGHFNAPIKHHFLDIPVAQWEGVIEPDTVTNNFNGKSVVFVADAYGLALTDAARAHHES